MQSIISAGVRPGITAIRCPVCEEMNQRMGNARGTRVANSVFVPLSFKQQALLNLGYKLTHTGQCSGSGEWGTHYVTITLRTVGRISDEPKRR